MGDVEPTIARVVKPRRWTVIPALVLALGGGIFFAKHARPAAIATALGLIACASVALEPVRRPVRRRVGVRDGALFIQGEAPVARDDIAEAGRLRVRQGEAVLVAVRGQRTREVVLTSAVEADAFAAALGRGELPALALDVRRPVGVWTVVASFVATGVVLTAAVGEESWYGVRGQAIAVATLAGILACPALVVALQSARLVCAADGVGLRSIMGTTFYPRSTIVGVRRRWRKRVVDLVLTDDRSVRLLAASAYEADLLAARADAMLASTEDAGESLDLFARGARTVEAWHDDMTALGASGEAYRATPAPMKLLRATAANPALDATVRGGAAIALRSRSGATASAVLQTLASSCAHPSLRRLFDALANQAARSTVLKELADIDATSREPPPSPRMKLPFLQQLAITLGIVGLLAVGAIYGVRKYICNCLSSEARANVRGIAKQAAFAYERDGVLCPSSRASIPSDPAHVANKRYVARPDEWTRDPGFACLGYSVDYGQHYTLRYEQLGPRGVGGSFVVTAEGDGNGDGVLSHFELRGGVGRDGPYFEPALVEVHPEE